MSALQYDRKEFNSFCVLSLLFSSTYSLLYKFTAAPIFSPEIVLPILLVIFLTNTRNLKYLPFYIIIYLCVVLMFSLVLFENHPKSVEYYVKLMVFFTIPPILYGSLDLEFNKFWEVAKVFALVNFALLLYLVVFRQDMYLDVEYMNYMTFGYWMLQSSLVFFIISYRYNSFKYMLLSVFCFLLIINFGSRFAIVSCIIGFISIRMLFKGFTIKFALALISTSIIFLISYMNLSEILYSSILTLRKLNIEPISLVRIYVRLGQTLSESSSGRTELWLNSYDLIQSNPFGYGLINYSQHLDSLAIFKYPHNIFIQLFLEYGVILASVLIFFLLFLVLCFFRRARFEERLLAIFYLSITSKLLVSGNYMWEATFWLFLTLILTKVIKN
ncbi:hypothetical protein BCV02_05040 [Vibrio breoganii]|uniref:O-antigen ligase family protein n=1 Tax=Vibrio breoganii TaxID=553239 RepID=UPI000C81D53A|nr:hypothetical protein BCV02_05040 [Vibrio breoganii]